MCCFGTISRFPYIEISVEHDFPRLTKHRGGARSQGGLLRPLRLGGGGGPYYPGFAACLPDPLVSGYNLFNAFATMPAISDQALHRAHASITWTQRSTMKARSSEARLFLQGKQPRRAGSFRKGDAGSRRGNGLSKARQNFATVSAR